MSGVYYTKYELYYFGNVVFIIFYNLLFPVCFKCLLNAENKLVCASLSGNLYKRRNVSDFESICIEILYETKGKSNEIIGIINKPNTQSRADFDVFTSTLFELLEIINHKHIKCKLLRDFNIHLLNYGHHDKTNTYVDIIFLVLSFSNYKAYQSYIYHYIIRSYLLKYYFTKVHEWNYN